jgi:multidrug efflux pump subunit AcrA (membrane-fusion protein)
VSDPNARTFLVRVRLDNGDGRYAPGMSARATLRLDTGRMGLVVHRDALIRYPDGRITVWVADGAGAERSVREQRVRTGLRFGDHVEVTEGLEAGMPVVVRGNETLQDGQTVQVVSDA